MNLPQDIELLATAALRGETISLTPSHLSPAQTDPLFDPLTSTCFTLAATLLKQVPVSACPLTGIIVGTHHGCLRTDITFDQSRRESGGRFASPAAFRGTLPSTLPTELSVRLSLHGPILVVLRDIDFAQLALNRAVAWMRHMPLEYCIAGGFDEPIGEAAQATFHLLRFTGINKSA